jgi:hypothetical protein
MGPRSPRCTVGPATGLGTNFRVAGDRVMGSGLDLGGELLHVTAFVSDGTYDGGVEVSISVPPPRIAPTSGRRAQGLTRPTPGPPSAAHRRWR